VSLTSEERPTDQVLAHAACTYQTFRHAAASQGIPPHAVSCTVAHGDARTGSAGRTADHRSASWCPCAPPGRGPCVPCEINTLFFSTAATRPARTRAQQLALADLP
jgi:hypothetical protein